MSCENCVNRREFISRSTVAALAVVSACGDGFLSAPTGGAGPPPEQFSVIVSNFAGLDTPGVLVNVGNAVAAKRTASATFDAFHMSCTHQGCTVNITGGQRFDCPCHFSRFDDNGAVINGPAKVPLRRLATSYDAATDTLTIG